MITYSAPPFHYSWPQLSTQDTVVTLFGNFESHKPPHSQLTDPKRPIFGLVPRAKCQNTSGNPNFSDRPCHFCMQNFQLCSQNTDIALRCFFAPATQTGAHQKPKMYSFFGPTPPVGCYNTSGNPNFSDRPCHFCMKNFQLCSQSTDCYCLKVFFLTCQQKPEPIENPKSSLLGAQHPPWSARIPVETHIFLKALPFLHERLPVVFNTFI